jgi:hypothetical protein
VLFQYCTVGTPLDPICGLFPSIQEQSLITATPLTQCLPHERAASICAIVGDVDGDGVAEVVFAGICCRQSVNSFARPPALPLGGERQEAKAAAEVCKGSFSTERAGRARCFVRGAHPDMLLYRSPLRRSISES